MNKQKNLLATLVAPLLFAGCDISSLDTVFEGQVVDSYVENLQYTCVDGSSGKTDINGKFKCQGLPIKFSIGGMEVGSISSLADDKNVFPQELLGLDRNNTTDTNLIVLTQFLQTLDADNNASNGIGIDMNQVALLPESSTTFNADDINIYTQAIGETLVDEDTAMTHLTETMEMVEKLDNLEIPQPVLDYVNSPKRELSADVITALNYMGDEERLAYDIYRELYKAHDTNQHNNIATKSEINHINAVRAMLIKYDIKDTELYANDPDSLTVGSYANEHINDLYNELYNAGMVSKQASLEVGCKVEVVDVNDLDEYIAQAKESNASDVQGVFEYLRNGSYNHYWSFDSGLKKLDVTEGCCSLGDEWCKTESEYPKSSEEGK